MQLENVEDIYALSPIQSGMLFHSISEPNSGVFVQQISFTLRGDWQLERFRESWNKVVHRYAALRTIFLWEEIDEPLQVVRERVAIPWQQLDRNGNLVSAHEKYLRQDRSRGFDLADGPLMRFAEIDLGNSQTQIIWTYHHLIADGWSTALILKEVFKTYLQLENSDDAQIDAPFRYADFIGHVQSQSLEKAESFWREQLAGFDSPTRLVDRVGQRDSEDNHHGEQRLKLSDDLSQQIKKFAQEHRLTVNSIVVGAWAAVLSMHTREHDVVFGTTVSGRPPQLTGIESAVGLFINTLPLRVRIDDSSVVDWLRRIQKDQVLARDFELSPLASVQQWSDVPRGSALLQSIVVYENYPDVNDDALDSQQLSVEAIEHHEQSNYPVALLVVPGAQIDLRIVHDQTQFSKTFACQLLENVEQRLATFISNANAKIGELPHLSEVVQQKIVYDWNDTACEFDTHRSIHSLIEAQAVEHPDAIAVAFGGQTMTYRVLNEKSNKLAQAIQAGGVSPQSHVGVFVDRSFDMIVGILGILKSGSAYVPLDPTYPAEQLQRLADTARLSAVVTLQSRSADVPRGPWKTIEMDNLESQNATKNKSHVENGLPRDGESTAYVIFTSGSSGQPKGVPISHQNLINSTLARREFYGAPVERFLLLSSFSFDSSLVGIFWTLVDGGTLVLPPPKAEQDLRHLATLIEEHRITHLLALPTLYELLLKHSPATQLSSLKTAIVAGEAASGTLVDQHHSSLSNTRLYNEYGPTESTVWCTACELTVNETATPIPIGRPISNTHAYVLDPQRRAVPPGVCGELHLSGAGLTKGYLDQPELTKSKFVLNPFGDAQNKRMYRTGDLAYFRSDGQLVFAGRIDQQVKIRGHRIELGEIENVLLQHAAVNEAVATARSVSDDNDLAARMQKLSPAKVNELMRDLLAMSDAQLDQELQSQAPTGQSS